MERQRQFEELALREFYIALLLSESYNLLPWWAHVAEDRLGVAER